MVEELHNVHEQVISNLVGQTGPTRITSRKSQAIMALKGGIPISRPCVAEGTAATHQGDYIDAMEGALAPIVASTPQSPWLAKWACQLDKRLVRYLFGEPVNGPLNSASKNRSQARRRSDCGYPGGGGGGGRMFLRLCRGTGRHSGRKVIR